MNEHTPIKVICPIHGAFYVKPSVFLDKQLNVLCPECYKTGEWLIEKLTQKYNNYYNLTNIAQMFHRFLYFSDKKIFTFSRIFSAVFRPS